MRIKNCSLLIFALSALFTAGTVWAGGNSCSVSGKIFIRENAAVYVFLVDEESSAKPFSGIHTVTIVPDSRDIAAGYVSYRFTALRPGTYGIRCYQDTNNNSRLDKGLFGPAEPWGLSWNTNSTSGWPAFRNFCFEVLDNKKSIDITLTE